MLKIKSTNFAKMQKNSKKVDTSCATKSIPTLHTIKTEKKFIQNSECKLFENVDSAYDYIQKNPDKNLYVYA
jgi:hypothetical protein